MVLPLLGLVLWACVGLSGIAVVAALIMSFTAEIGGWGFALALWFVLTTITGFKFMKMAMRDVERGFLAGVLVTLTLVIVGVRLLFNPPSYSAWWGLLTPIAFIIVSSLLAVFYSSITRGR